MKRTCGAYEIDDDGGRIDFARVHAWLTATYWWPPDTPRARIEQAAAGSALVIGAYDTGGQVGYARAVSDRTTFAWVTDVVVEPAHRGRGIARAMVRLALEHPDFQDLRRWLLSTRDAHGVYAPLGFQPLARPQAFMVIGPEARPVPGV